MYVAYNVSNYTNNMLQVIKAYFLKNGNIFTNFYSSSLKFYAVMRVKYSTFVEYLITEQILKSSQKEAQ